MNNILEIFKDIPGYEGLYQVSNFGNIKSLDKIILRKRGKTHHSYILKGRLLKLLKDNNNYLMVGLYKNYKPKTYRIHQLIAMAFLNHKPGERKIVVDHIDHNKSNNNLKNIQIITCRENCSKDRKNGTSKYTGVSWDTRVKKWVAAIQINGISKCLGYFNNELQAAEKYQNELKNI